VLLSGLVAIYASRTTGCPVVISLHCNDDTDFKELLKAGTLPWSTRHVMRLAWLRLFQHYIISHADKVICRYDALKNYALHHGAREQNTHIIYNWIDTDRFRPVGPQGRNGKIKVISVNRQDPEKNPEPLIRAMNGLNAELVLIGHGVLHNKLKLLAREVGVGDRVKFITSVPHKNLHRYYQEADIGAVCIDMVGVSMGTMEAMASALPIVCSRTRWSNQPEVVGDIAVMVDPTPEGFRRGITQLAQDSELRSKLGALGRERILSIRGELMESQEADLYTQLLT
jgi:glycosyltransferase involved in cell wall biosynthesis